MSNDLATHDEIADAVRDMRRMEAAKRQYLEGRDG